MIRIVFLVGRPGSGKSYIAQFIQKFATIKNWKVDHIYDYQLLQEMFLEESSKALAREQRSFQPVGPENLQGFRVINFAVLDVVLEKIAGQVKEELSASSKENKLILIEFARNDYAQALHRFGTDILQGAFVFYINAGVDTCLERVHRRINDVSPFAHFVSDDILQGYYQVDGWLDEKMCQYLALLEGDHISIYLEEINNAKPCGDISSVIEEIVNKQLIPDLVEV